MAHPVVYFAISGPDVPRLADFYAGLLGWRMQPVAGVNYTLVHTGGGINGGIAASTDGSPATTFYVEADDLQAVLDRVNLIGGKTVTPITELPGMATYALFDDLDGLVVGLVPGPPSADGLAPAAAGPAQAEATGAPVDWFEVLGADATRSQRFYAEIFGWQISQAGPGYGMVDTGTSRGIRGRIGAGKPGPWVAVYASVADVGATLARAAELGGSGLHGPAAVDGHLQTGALRDPAGNVFGIYYHAPH